MTDNPTALAEHLQALHDELSATVAEIVALVKALAAAYGVEWTGERGRGSDYNLCRRLPQHPALVARRVCAMRRHLAALLGPAGLWADAVGVGWGCRLWACLGHA